MKLWLRDPLTFPAGYAPGFDPTHIAAKGISGGGVGQSVVAQGANFRSLFSGAAATASGPPGSSILSAIGPGAGFTVSGQFATFPQPVQTPAAITAAAIFQLPTANVSVFQGIIRFSTQQTLLLLNGVFGWYNGGNQSSGIAASNNVPYFYASSVINNGKTYFVVTNLATGQIFQATVASVTGFTAFNTTLQLGNNSSTTSFLGGNIAAAMWSPTFLSQQALLQWAQRPWDFWYPPSVNDWIFSELVGKSGTFYTVAAASGAYVFSGQAAALNSGRSLGATVGAFTFSGKAAAFPVALSLQAAAGAYAFAGKAATFAVALSLQAAAGAYVFAGKVVTFTSAIGSKVYSYITSSYIQ